MVAIPSIPSEFLQDLHINGLKGRVLELPAPTGKEDTLPILLIYGHHSSLERMYSTAQAFNVYGQVTVPDLPGFGGMPSLVTIRKMPDIDNLADYLAAFIRQRYPHGQKFILEGMSLGFVLSVRMLQRHPDLTAQVAHLVSIVGFVHHGDFLMNPRRQKLFAQTARMLAKRAAASVFSGFILQKPIIATTYHLRARSHPKMKGYSWQERQDLINFELTLWKTNEVRTYFTTMSQMLTLDLTTQKLNLPVEHIGADNDQYFNNAHVKQHLEKIFTKVSMHKAVLPNHVPTVLEEAEDARALIPKSVVHIFNAKA